MPDRKKSEEKKNWAWFSPRPGSKGEPQDLQRGPTCGVLLCPPARSQELPGCQLLCHVEQQAAVRFFDASHKTAKLVQNARVFPVTAPNNIVRRLALGEVGKFRRLLAVVEELIEWNLERAGQFLKRFNGRNCVAIFHSRDVATQKPCTLFDVPLRELLFFAQCAKSVAYNHVANYAYGSTLAQVKIFVTQAS